MLNTLVFVTFDLEWCSNCARPVLWCHISKSE